MKEGARQVSGRPGPGMPTRPLAEWGVRKEQWWCGHQWAKHRSSCYFMKISLYFVFLLFLSCLRLPQEALSPSSYFLEVPLATFPHPHPHRCSLPTGVPSPRWLPFKGNIFTFKVPFQVSASNAVPARASLESHHYPGFYHLGLQFSLCSPRESKILNPVCYSKWSTAGGMWPGKAH